MNRRQFVRNSALGTAGLLLTSCQTSRRKISANEKLNLGIIGVAHQGGYDMNSVASENIVALCDVDEALLAGAKQKFPQAKTFNDFRRLLDEKHIDAVVIATPDHTHAVATAAALRSGRHVYCEKPLTRTISECRAVTELARKHKLITQMGTQIHSGDNYHQAVQKIQQGAIGQVSEVHVWVNATYGGKESPKGTPPAPAGLHYDLWLGPILPQPYHPEYVPINWRNWWPFGGGALADMGCHYMDLAHWALNLRSPLSAEVIDGATLSHDTPPPWLVVKYAYPSPNGSPLKLTWYHGGKHPALLPQSIYDKWLSGVLFIGTKGMMLADYTRHIILRDSAFADYSDPAAIGSDFTQHHKNWIRCVKENRPAESDFSYAGPLTEAVLLGNVAFRSGCKIDWDAHNLRARNCPAADQFIHHQYRPGWKL